MIVLMTNLYSSLKYFLTVVHIFANWRYKPIPIPKEPAIVPEDVSVIIPTYRANLQDLRKTIMCHLRNGCRHIYIAATVEEYNSIKDMTTSLQYPSAVIEVFASDRPSKRQQVRKAVESIPKSRKKTHKAYALADDDITFGDKTYLWALAPLEDEEVWGVATWQRAERLTTGLVLNQCINWTFATYLQRRVFENLATLSIDGSILCQSGRFGIFPARLIQNPEFLDGYTSERWNGKMLYADDDNYVTRYILRHGAKIEIQCHDDCMVTTKFGASFGQLKRFSRWQMSNFRSNWTTL